MKVLRRTSSYLLMFVFALAVISRSSFADDKIDVFVSIPPQAFFAEQVGGRFVNVHILVEPGQSPHIFEPTPKQLADLARAKIFFAIGLPFEKQLISKIARSNPGLVIVHTEEGVPVRQTALHSHEGHGHGEGAHDPHIWLDPKLVKIQAAAIARALEKADPEHAEQYRANLIQLNASLDGAASDIAALLAPFKGMPFYVYHPAFGYFADAFGIVQVPIEHEGKEPGGSELAKIIAGAKKHGARVIFIEPQFSKRQAEAIAGAIGGKVMILDPLAKDYLDNLKSMAEKISRAMVKEK